MKIEEISKKYLNYLQNRDCSEKTIEGYGNDLKMFYRWALKTDRAGTEIEDITRKDIREYIDYLEEVKYKYKTIKRRIAVTKGLFQFAYEREIIEESPFLRIDIRIKNHDPLPNVMELSEVTKFLYVVHNKAPHYSKITHTRDIAIIELLFSTGIRVAELTGLKYSDWDDMDHTFRFIGKGKKERIVYIDNREVLEALQNYMKEIKLVGSEYIFLSKNNTPMSTAAVRDVVRKYSDMAGFQKRITPHTFRRSYATLLIDSGLDISYVKNALGHSSISTTQFYVRLSEQSTRRALRNRSPRDAMSF